MMTAEMAQKVAESLTPAKTLEFWEYFKQGLDRRTSPSYERWVGIYHLGEGFCLVLALGGAAMVAAGIAARRKKKRGGRGGEGETGRWGNLTRCKTIDVGNLFFYKTVPEEIRDENSEAHGVGNI